MKVSQDPGENLIKGKQPKANATTSGQKKLKRKRKGTKKPNTKSDIEDESDSFIKGQASPLTAIIDTHRDEGGDKQAKLSDFFSPR